MVQQSKRWLMSVMRTSGSKRKYVMNGSYADGRHTKTDISVEELPHREGIKSTREFYNGKINYDLLLRFLRGQVGNDWDAVYSEAISRIPAKLLHHKEMIFWYVADDVEFIDGELWNKESQRFIWLNGGYTLLHYTEMKFQVERKEFYVDPTTNKLVHIPQKAFKKLIKLNK